MIAAPQADKQTLLHLRQIQPKRTPKWTRPAILEALVANWFEWEPSAAAARIAAGMVVLLGVFLPVRHAGELKRAGWR